MSDDFDLIVIGAGPGGYVAAIRGAQLGLKVACVEKNPTLGGTCLNVGCIPSKALLQSSELYEQARTRLEEHGVTAAGVSLDLARMMARKERIVQGLTQGIEGLLRKNKITWLRGTGKLAGPRAVSVDGVKYGAKHIILATGSAPSSLPNLPFDEDRIISSTGALALKEVPRHLLVVGGGIIGLELGSVYRRLGAKVTVIEFLDRILPGMDGDLSREMLKVMKKQGMEFHLRTKVVEAKTSRKEVKLLAENGSGKLELKGDHVLVAVGRKPYSAGLGLEEAGVATEHGRVLVNRRFESSVPGIYAIGDLVDGPMLAHKAEEEGSACAEIIARGHGRVEYLEIPSIIYTQPEVAGAGLSEEECAEHRLPVRIGRYPFKANPRARCLGEEEGFVKIISHAETDRVLGVHILGYGASELIAEAVLAMSFKASAEDIAMVCHGHPTLSEALKEAALAVHGRSIHI